MSAPDSGMLTGRVHGAASLPAYELWHTGREDFRPCAERVHSLNGDRRKTL